MPNNFEGGTDLDQKHSLRFLFQIWSSTSSAILLCASLSVRCTPSATERDSSNPPASLALSGIVRRYYLSNSVRLTVCDRLKASLSCPTNLHRGSSSSSQSLRVSDCTNAFLILWWMLFCSELLVGTLFGLTTWGKGRKIVVL